MSYKIQITKEKDYLHVKVIGTRTMQATIDMIKEVITTCDDLGLKKILVDVTEFKGQLDILHSYTLVKNLEELRQYPKFKTSVIDREDNREYFHFVENAAYNKGYRIGMFTDPVEAMKWLSQ